MGNAERLAGKMNIQPATLHSRRKEKKEKGHSGGGDERSKMKKGRAHLLHHKLESWPVLLKKRANSYIACSAFQLPSHAHSSKPSKSDLLLKRLKRAANVSPSHMYRAHHYRALIASIVPDAEQSEGSASPIKHKYLRFKAMPKHSLCIRNA